MTTPEQFRNIIHDLIDASYDTGYYSGQQRDGEPEHLAAIDRRTWLRDLALAAYNWLYVELEALTEEEL